MDLTQENNLDQRETTDFGSQDKVMTTTTTTNHIPELKDVTLFGTMFIGQELGKGAYGKVHSARYQEQDRAEQTYAVKEIHPLLIEGANEEEKEAIKRNFVRECLCCNANRHPNIVEFVGVHYSNESGIPIMAMEMMEHNLTSFVQKNKYNIAIKTKLSILYDVSCGLQFLHTRSPPIVHRDLSSNNVMLTSKLVAKIGDLGVAKVIKAETKSKMTTAPGTTDFMPPETLMADPVYGLPVDVFSFASITLHLFTEEWPSPDPPKMTDPQTKELVALSEVKRRKKYLDKMTSENAAIALRQLVERCLNDTPDERPSIQDVKDAIEPLKELPSLAEALQSSQCYMTWYSCSSLPSRIYNASVAIDDNNVYVGAGSGPDDHAYNNVYCYNISTDEWATLPPPGHQYGILCMVDKRLSIFGGSDPSSHMYLKKVSTYNKDTTSWSQIYPSMIQERLKPGVVCHGSYVIAMGGLDKPHTILNTIEVMNWQQKSPWRKVSTRLPTPMWAIKPTLSAEHILIVGYEQRNKCYTRVYKIPVAAVTSQSVSSDREINEWERLLPAPNYHTATVPFSDPPLIIGGSNNDGTSLTSAISMYDTSKKSWTMVDSLKSARGSVGIGAINSNTIIVIGGTTGGTSVEAVQESALSKVEIGYIVHN